MGIRVRLAESTDERTAPGEQAQKRRADKALLAKVSSRLTPSGPTTRLAFGTSIVRHPRRQRKRIDGDLTNVCARSRQLTSFGESPFDG
jgi:hypothetical protein